MKFELKSLFNMFCKKKKMNLCNTSFLEEPNFAYSKSCENKLKIFTACIKMQ